MSEDTTQRPDPAATPPLDESIRQVGAAGRAQRMNNPKGWKGAKDWLYNGHTGKAAEGDRVTITVDTGDLILQLQRTLVLDQ